MFHQAEPAAKHSVDTRPADAEDAVAISTGRTPSALSAFTSALFAWAMIGFRPFAALPERLRTRDAFALSLQHKLPLKGRDGRDEGVDQFSGRRGRIRTQV